MGNALRSTPSPEVSLGSFLRPLWVLAVLHLAGFPLPFVAVRVVPQFPFVAEALITHQCFGCCRAGLRSVKALLCFSAVRVPFQGLCLLVGGYA